MNFIGERRNPAENFTAKICWIALHYFHLHSITAFNYYIIDLLLSYLYLMLGSSPKFKLDTNHKYTQHTICSVRGQIFAAF